jgi:flavodoxin
MRDKADVSALVVYESWFGNTAATARAVASGLALEGLQVRCLPVSDAPLGPVSCDLLVVGAPTHAFGLSRPATREEALSKGATDVGSTTFAMREWLDQLPDQRHDTICAASFDTRADKARRLPFSAAPAARRRLLKRGYHDAGEPVGFAVDDISGPLLDGELERASAWGRDLAVTTKDHFVARGARETDRTAHPGG